MVAKHVYNKQQAPILGKSDHCVALLFVCPRVLEPKKRVEEHLTRSLKTDAMFADIAGCLLCVPYEPLTLIEKEDIRRNSRIYNVCISSL